MEPLINLVNQAIAAFKRRDYEAVVLLLDNAFEYIRAIDHTAIDERIFNALYDAYEMLELISQLAVFEKNQFLNQCFANYKAALDAFTQQTGGSLAQLQQALLPFLQLLDGMSVSVKYLQRQKLHIGDFPPEISFEITEDGHLRLYAWTEEEPRIANIQKLKAEFDQLFAQEKHSENHFLETATKLYAAAQYEECLAVLEQAMLHVEAQKGECYVRKGMVYMQLKMYEEAVDSFMKARVLGEPKHRVAEQGRAACQQLLRWSETREERAQWTSLLNDFF